MLHDRLRSGTQSGHQTHGPGYADSQLGRSCCRLLNSVHRYILFACWQDAGRAGTRRQAIRLNPQNALGATPQLYHRTLPKRFPFDIYGMHGNTRQLCSDWKHAELRIRSCRAACVGWRFSIYRLRVQRDMPIETNASKANWAAAVGSSVASCSEICVSRDRIVVNRETLRIVCPTKTAKSQTRSSLFGVIPVQ